MYMMWPSTDAELKEEETHLLIFFGIFYCMQLRVLHLVLLLSLSLCEPDDDQSSANHQKGGDCLTPLQWL